MKRGFQAIMELPFVRGPAVLIFSVTIALHVSTGEYGLALYTYVVFEIALRSIARIRTRPATARPLTIALRHIEALQIVRDGNWHNVMSAWNALNPNIGMRQAMRMVRAFNDCVEAGLVEFDVERSDHRHFWVRLTDEGRKALEERTKAIVIEESR